MVARSGGEDRRDPTPARGRAFYTVTEPVDGLPRHLPVLFPDDAWTGCKEHAGKLPVGFVKPNAKAWGQKGIPDLVS